MSGIFPFSIKPARCITVDENWIEFDLNHPFANRTGELKVEVLSVAAHRRDMGGRCRDWIGDLLDGPGMQARLAPDVPTNFWDSDAFHRTDESPDGDFYDQPRLVQHVDSRGLNVIQDLYGSLLARNGEVLDLMASHDSHLPSDCASRNLAGLGLNAAELDANALLTEKVVHDLNLDPTLPFKEERFDAVISTVSIDYLTRPFEVFAEVRRVLRPGGLFVVTFSNRWFPPKVVKIWERVHEFERLGLVCEYFLKDGYFRDVHTFSQRGLPRPADDPYTNQLATSDPVYAVWAYKI